MNDTLSATDIGKCFNKTSRQINDMFNELGWIEKRGKGWAMTVEGQKQGGVQNNFKGTLSVRWAKGIENNVILQKFLTPQSKVPDEIEDFRKKFPAEHRTTDGHFVRSKSEMIIDDWLYRENIVHAYEKRLPIEEDVYSDFYLPSGKVYIEFWGYENDSKYLHRKQIKQAIYQKYGFRLIELCDKDVNNLDDILPQQLLKYGINIV